jgi:hypothetical protein
MLELMAVDIVSVGMVGLFWWNASFELVDSSKLICMLQIVPSHRSSPDFEGLAYTKPSAESYLGVQYCRMGCAASCFWAHQPPRNICLTT